MTDEEYEELERVAKEDHGRALEEVVKIANADPDGVRTWLDERDREERRARASIVVFAVTIVVGGLGLAVYVGLLVAGIL